MDSESDDSDDNICPICNRSFETMAGIRQQWTKGHSDSEIVAAINNNSQLPTPASRTLPTSTIASSTQSSSARTTNPPSLLLVEILNRVTCIACGFLAKNERGLKIHWGFTTVNLLLWNRTSHWLQQISTHVTKPASFGNSVSCFKCSIPLVRIIQKSVRTTVCQELTSGRQKRPVCVVSVVELPADRLEHYSKKQFQRQPSSKHYSPQSIRFFKT